MGAQLEEEMDDGQGEWTRGLACRVTVACMGEERGRQSGAAAAAAGWLPVDAGLCGRVVVVDEVRLLSLLVSVVLEEHCASPLPPLDRDV